MFMCCPPSGAHPRYKACQVSAGIVCVCVCACTLCVHGTLCTMGACAWCPAMLGRPTSAAVMRRADDCMCLVSACAQETNFSGSDEDDTSLQGCSSEGHVPGSSNSGKEGLAARTRA
eukprot:scaffold260736_cov23-Tisochrysis_lutea.AAC.1